MESKNKNVTGKSTFSVILYAAGSITALIGIASLVNTILQFKNTVSQYVAQGYPADIVNKQLIPSQLLPGIFEAIGIYGGIAIALFGIGVAINRVSRCFVHMNKAEVYSEAVVENIEYKNAADAQNTEGSIPTEPAEEAK